MTPRPPRPPAWIAATPNALSALRLGLGVAFPFVAPGWRLPLVLAGATTDVLDGQVARRGHVTSFVGGLLDAVADKVLALAVLATLLLEGDVTPVEVALVLLRDIVVAAIAAFFSVRRQWLAFEGMPSRWLGKSTTLLLFAWFVALLVPVRSLADPLFVLLAASSALAAGDYVQAFVRTWRDGRIHVRRRADLRGPTASSTDEV